MIKETVIEHKGLKFICREGFSDEKTFKEVIVNNSYQKRGIKINSGETWHDMGANVGAFAVLASSLGANVICYEPDPANIKQIRRNLEINGLKAEIKPFAVVGDNSKSATMNLWTNGQSWRNSLIRNKKGTEQITVFCYNFFDLVKPGDCAKVDIEGSEIEIFKNYKKTGLKKLVFEWSFDADCRTSILVESLTLLKKEFKEVKYPPQVEKIKEWKFFPACAMVHCYN